MKTFEEFCRSNILQVILKFHNEGGSRDVERLTRMAFEEYTATPHLRHIDSYYLNEIRFFPPTLTDQEQILFDQNHLKPCYVDLGNGDNWCLRTERYVLLKLKRSDDRENCVIANSKMYRVNRQDMIYKYCRKKFREAREESQKRATERERRNADKVKQNISNVSKEPSPSCTRSAPRITDFFHKQTRSAQTKKMQLLRLFNNPDKNIYQASGSTNSQDSNSPHIEQPELQLRPGPASKKRQMMERMKSEAKKPRIINVPIQIEREPVVDRLSEEPDKELEAIKEQLTERGLKVRPGPRSRKKAYLELVKRKEEALENVPKVRPCPASKKGKYLAKSLAKEKPMEQEVNQEDQENIDSPNLLPLPSTPNKPAITVNLPTPLTESIPVAQSLLAVPPRVPKKEPVRGSKLWLLMYGIYDPVRKCFYDPEDPPPLTSAEQSSKPEFDFSPLNVSSPMVVQPKQRITPPSPSPPNQSLTPDFATDRSPLLISYSQVNPMDEVDNTIDMVLERNAREVLHPKLFQYPALLRKVKSILTGKAKLFGKEREQEKDNNASEVAVRECRNSPVAGPSRSTNIKDLDSKPLATPSTSRSSDKLSLAASQDSFVTVIEVNTQQTATLVKSRESSRLKSTPQKKAITSQPVPVTPEVVLCDRLGTQPVSLDNTQPFENPLQTQEILSPEEGHKMWVDSEVEISTVPEEIIEIEDNSCSMVNEILGEESPATPPPKIQPPSSPAPERTPRRNAGVQPNTPVTRSRTKNISGSTTTQIKVEAGTPVKRSGSPLKKGSEGAAGKIGEIGADTEANRVAYRYNALPLQLKKGAKAAIKIKIAPKRKRKQVDSRQASCTVARVMTTRFRIPCHDNTISHSLDVMSPSEDIYTAVRFGEPTEATAAGLDIQDASLVADTLADDEGEETTTTTANRSRKSKRVRTLLSQLKEIAERQEQTLQKAAQTETHPFSAHQVTGLSYKTDGKGNFYSDSCGAQCSFSVNFTVDGLRRLQFHVDINRHLLNLTQGQWESFQRLLQSVNELEYVGWEKDRRRTGARGDCCGDDDDEDYEGVRGVGSCVVKRALGCLLKTTPKLGVNVGAIKFNTCVGARPVYLSRMSEVQSSDRLDLTECIDPRILQRLEKEVERQ